MTSTKEQIEKAWAKAGLYPISQSIMLGLQGDGAQHTPPPPTTELPADTLSTPHTTRQNQMNMRKLRKTPSLQTAVLEKLDRGFDMMSAENACLKKEMESLRAAVELKSKSTGSKKRARYPHGELFDPTYQIENREALAARKHDEEVAAGKRRAIALQPEDESASNLQV